jgi:hypothetical protein
VGVAPFKTLEISPALLCWVLIRVFIYIHLCVCALHLIFFRLAGEENYARDYVCEACSLSLRYASGARALSSGSSPSSSPRGFSTPAHSFFLMAVRCEHKADDHAEITHQESAPLNTWLIPSFQIHLSFTCQKVCARGTASKNDGFQFFTLEEKRIAQGLEHILELK